MIPPVPLGELIKAILEFIGSIIALFAELGGLVMFAISAWHKDWQQGICWALFIIYMYQKAPKDKK